MSSSVGGGSAGLGGHVALTVGGSSGRCRSSADVVEACDSRRWRVG